MTDLRERIRKLWKNARVRIIFWATFTGLACGITGVGLPFEDVISNARNYLRLQPSNGEIAVVLQDNETLDALGAIDVSRANDAEVVDALFKAGAKRIFFDRALNYYASDEGNQKFIDVLR
ncbi:MAG TPA: diguanylate phosphodiesterase, partial [Novosphingobium sp.]|nr:diguanylate phosphodiesterase [Novosphingobium sp.]